MQITNNIINHAAASGTAPASNTAAASANPVSGMASQQTFLQLLVAQIKNQDPMSPTDSMQFVTQLAQFSSLEQLIGINQGISTLNTDVASVASPGTNPPAGQ